MKIPAMSEELEQLLKNLKLRRMLEIYEEQLRAAEKQDVTYAEFLTRLLRAQWHYRQETPWSIASAAPNCPNAGRWKPFPSMKALENGYRCQFIRAQDLFGDQLARGNPDGKRNG